MVLTLSSKPPNRPRHRIAALWREGINPKGHVGAARGALGRSVLISEMKPE